MTGKPLPAPGVFQYCLGCLASPWHAPGLSGCGSEEPKRFLLAQLTAGETVRAAQLGCEDGPGD